MLNCGARRGFLPGGMGVSGGGGGGEVISWKREGCFTHYVFVNQVPFLLGLVSPHGN